MNAATRAASISAVIALTLAAVWFLWPIALGGGTTYVTTHGISMEPRFHTGDLAILRAADSYSVGDVAAYRSDSLDTVVMHRIVEVDGDRFVFQGDNNDFLDEDRPTESQLLGTLLVRIPHGGKALGVIRSPMVLALAGVAVLLGIAATGRPSSRHRARRHRRAAPALAMPAFSMPMRARARQVALTSGAAALLAAAVGGVLLVVPSTETVTRDVQVTQQGTFTYSATAEAGTTYPAGVVSTGDTVWTSLVRGLSVSFTNTVSGPDLADVRGAVRLDATVASSDGWSTYLTSSPVVDLENGTATVAVPIDPARAWDLLKRHYAETGSGGGSASLTVTPAVATTGTAQGASFEAGSLAGLQFALDPSSLHLTGDPEAVLAPSTTTPVTVHVVGPRRFEVFTVAVPISVARLVALAVLVLALVCFAAGAWIGRIGRGDVADEFLVRHADRILPVARFTPGPNVIDVADVEALNRVAERFDTLVLHHAGPDEHVFAVRDVDATYRFVVPDGSERRAKPPVPAPAPEPEDATAPLVVPGSTRRDLPPVPARVQAPARVTAPESGQEAPQPSRAVPVALWRQVA